MLLPKVNIKRNRFAEGFTLTELLVVVTLIVAMLMVLLPALQAFRQGRVEQAANYQLVADMNNARHQALLNGSPLPSPEPLKRTVPLDLFPTSSNTPPHHQRLHRMPAE